MLNHVGTKEIETDRLLLRQFREGDAGDMYQNWASDEEVTKFLTWPTHKELTVSERILEDWVAKNKELQNYQWAITLKNTGEVIGSFSIMNIDNHNESCEAGYCIGRKWWNQGLMTEALQAVIRFCFTEVGFIRVAARHEIHNVASGCVMKKCGMEYEGTLRKVLKNSKGVLVDCRYYSILRDETE